MSPEIKFVYPLKYKNVTFCGPEFVLYVRWGESKKETVVINVSHFPKSIWDKMKSENVWHTVGHSHLGFPETHPHTTNTGKVLDCGWDFLKRPINFWEVKSYMDKKKMIKKDANH